MGDVRKKVVTTATKADLLKTIRRQPLKLLSRLRCNVEMGTLLQMQMPVAVASGTRVALGDTIRKCEKRAFGVLFFFSGERAGKVGACITLLVTVCTWTFLMTISTGESGPTLLFLPSPRNMDGGSHSSGIHLPSSQSFCPQQLKDWPNTLLTGDPVTWRHSSFIHVMPTACKTRNLDNVLSILFRKLRNPPPPVERYSYNCRYQCVRRTTLTSDAASKVTLIESTI